MNELDQDAVRLAKAIRYTESRDKEDAKGASGEFGLYQWMPDTWASTTKKYGLDSNDVSRENQNKAAYMSIKELKDAGHGPDQIAAFWNSGKTDGWENKRGTNKYGVNYDVPAYVGKVKQQYEHLKTSEQPLNLTTPSTPGHETFGTPDDQINPIKEIAIGEAKGLAGTALGMARFGETVANQTAGRLVSAVRGKGLVPMTPEERQSGVEVKGTEKANVLDKQLESKNKYQKVGKVLEGAAEFLIPGGGAKKVADSRKLANAASEAFEVVAPKASKAVLKDALKSRRTQVEGFFRSETMTPDARTERAARAVEDLVKSGKVGASKTASENANAVYDEIGATAEKLVSELKNQEIKLILQPEELRGIIQNASARIGEDPTMVGNATESANRIFRKFESFLPKGRDITAEDLLAARKQLDAWVRSLKGDKIFDPATENAMSIALRAVRQETNDLIAAKAPDIAVKESLSRQSALYDALDNIAEKGYKEIGTDVRSRYFQRHPFQKELLKGAIQGLIPLGAAGYVGSKVTGD